MLVVKSGFHKRKILSENYPQFWHALARRFASPALNYESLENSGLKERHIFSLPGAPTCLGPTLEAVEIPTATAVVVYSARNYGLQTQELTYLLHGAQSFSRN